MISKIKKNLKYIKPKDILSFFIFILVVIPAAIFKLINKIRKKKLLLVTENGKTARDNGYHFYKYVNAVKNPSPNPERDFFFSKTCRCAVSPLYQPDSHPQAAFRRRIPVREGCLSSYPPLQMSAHPDKEYHHPDGKQRTCPSVTF